MLIRVENHFWVAGDFQITLATGATQEVLHLVHNREEASNFGLRTATNIKEFVSRRINSRQGNNPAVKFELEPSLRPQGLWVIHGVQEVEIDAES